MKKTTFKGFTLIECLVALAILGIASLIMAQIYANVSRINYKNHIENNSLANQMQYIEMYTDSETESVYYSGSNTADATPAAPKLAPHVSYPSTNGNYITITSDYEYKDSGSTAGAKNVYSYSADIYVLLSRDYDDKASDDSDYKGETEDYYNLRYKYILGHANS